MSQDLKRERSGVQFESIAGATHYIAQLEAENARLKQDMREVYSLCDSLWWAATPHGPVRPIGSRIEAIAKTWTERSDV